MSGNMSTKKDEILRKLKHMKREVARKERKLQKCLRASSAKEHVQRKLREQNALADFKGSHHLPKAVNVVNTVGLPQSNNGIRRSNEFSGDLQRNKSISKGSTGPDSYPDLTQGMCKLNNNFSSITPDVQQECDQICFAKAGIRSEKRTTLENCIQTDQIPRLDVSNIRTSPLIVKKNVENSGANEIKCKNLAKDTHMNNRKSSVSSCSTGQTILEHDVETEAPPVAPSVNLNTQLQAVIKSVGTLHCRTNHAKNATETDEMTAMSVKSNRTQPLHHKSDEQVLSCSSSVESVGGAENFDRKSLSLKRKRDISASISSCTKESSTPKLTGIMTSGKIGQTEKVLTLHTNVCVHDKENSDCVTEKQMNFGDKIKDATDSEAVSLNLEHKLDFKSQVEQLTVAEPILQGVKSRKQASLAKNQGSVSSQKDIPKTKRKPVKRRRRTLGRIIDVDLEKDLNFKTDTESSQNSEEYETLLLIQQSYRSGVDYSTRNGKTRHLPTMLSSVFQYFIDETRRKKEQEDFSLPQDQFGRLMKKHLKHDSVVSPVYCLNGEKNDKLDTLNHDNTEDILSSSRDGVPVCYQNKSESPLDNMSDICSSHGQRNEKNDRKYHSHSTSERRDSKSVTISGSESTNEETLFHYKNINPKTTNHTELSDGLAQADNSEYLKTPKCVRKIAEEDFTVSPALFGSPEQFHSLERKDTTEVLETVKGNDSEGSQGQGSQRNRSGEKMKHQGCFKVLHTGEEPLECVSACCVQNGRRRTDIVACVSLSAISVWEQSGNMYYCKVEWPLDQMYVRAECQSFPAVFRERFCYFIVLLRTENVEGVVKIIHYDSRTGGVQLVHGVVGNSVVACCLSPENVAIGLLKENNTHVSKFCIESDGHLTSRQELEPVHSAPKCLMFVEDLSSAVTMWTKDNTLVLWNTDTGTLVWTLDLCPSWPELSTLVSIHWQQNYFFLSVLTDKKSDQAGGMLIVNPETNASKVLCHYRAPDWEGMKQCTRNDDNIVATDCKGRTFLWELHTGQLCYQTDKSSGVCGLGQYWRKYITIYRHCVHVFSR